MTKKKFNAASQSQSEQMYAFKCAEAGSARSHQTSQSVLSGIQAIELCFPHYRGNSIIRKREVAQASLNRDHRQRPAMLIKHF
jgi:hypothetical protein